MVRLSSGTTLLIDVYGTLVSVDVDLLWSDVAGAAGVAPEVFRCGADACADAVMRGRQRLTDAFAAGLRACSVTPSEPDLDQLLTIYLGTMSAGAHLYDDAVTFIEDRRAAGDDVVLVSSCAEDTRPLLTALGVTALTDRWVLSCEVGAVKPEGAMFERALGVAAVDPERAVLVDDDVGYCRGAVAAGIAAIHLDRGGPQADYSASQRVTTFAEIAVGD